MLKTKNTKFVKKKMLILISPAKTLKTDIHAIDESTIPVLINKSKILASTLKQYKPAQLSELMGISAKLAQLNYERYQQWKSPYTNKESFNPIFTFRGEVFNGINIDDFSKEELIYTQKHLRILSGLYGVLQPMDAILPYRLEMGTKLKHGEYKNLYQYWDNDITISINKDLSNLNEDTLINLASEEYFKSINTKILKANIITPVFKEHKNGKYKVISIFAKKARGMMTRFILKQRINDPVDIKHFTESGYYFNDEMSTESVFTFVR